MIPLYPHTILSAECQCSCYFMFLEMGNFPDKSSKRGNMNNHGTCPWNCPSNCRGNPRNSETDGAPGVLLLPPATYKDSCPLHVTMTSRSTGWVENMCRRRLVPGGYSCPTSSIWLTAPWRQPNPSAALRRPGTDTWHRWSVCDGSEVCDGSGPQGWRWVSGDQSSCKAVLKIHSNWI